MEMEVGRVGKATAWAEHQAVVATVVAKVVVGEAAWEVVLVAEETAVGTLEGRGGGSTCSIVAEVLAMVILEAP